MQIAGLQKLTLLDFPGRTACTVFFGGCNFRCPFCHNGSLLDGGTPSALDQETLLAFLDKRRGLLDGVCVTGGEPTLQPELPRMLRRIKALGYQIKLDTNGSRPDVLKALVTEHLVDYVAMDVKNCPERWGETVGIPGLELSPLKESLMFLLSDAVDYELRTTVVADFHDEASVLAMGRMLAGLVPGKQPRRLFLQCFVDGEGVLQPGLTPPQQETLCRFRKLLAPFVQEVAIRGQA